MFSEIVTALKQRQLSTAKSKLKNIAHLAHNHPRYWFLQSLAAYKEGEYNECQVALEEALAMKPTYQAALLLMALNAGHLKDFQGRYRALARLRKENQGQQVTALIKKHHKWYLVVDDENPLLDTSGMKYKEFQSDYNQIRFYTFMLMQHFPDSFYDDRLFAQQVGEIIKNAIRHGNRGKITSRVKVWYSLEPRLHIIFEDEGEGFRNLNEWNLFHHERMTAIEAGDFERAQEMMNFRHADSQEGDGGNSLIASLNYWDEGLIYNARKNRVAVVRTMR